MRWIVMLIALVCSWGWLDPVPCGAALVSPVLLCDDPTEVPGVVSRVTLYRGQALVTRKLALDGPAGSREIVVSNLPATVLDTSLYAETQDGLEIRAVRFRQRAVGEEPRAEVRELDQRIAELTASQALIQKRLELTTQKLAYLDQLQGFVAPTAISELTRGVLNAETLRELTRFAFEERGQISEQQVAANRELQKSSEDLALLQRQREELAAVAVRSVNEAVLFVEKLADGPQTVELNYLVSECGWSPAYNIRSNGSQDQVVIEYNALIQQLSGEDWKDVQLTLSTASPSVSASGPSLSAFHVTLGVGAEAAQVAAGSLDEASRLAVQYRANRSAQGVANAQLGNLFRFEEKTSLNWSINQMACSNQQFELSNPMEAVAMAMSEEGLDDSPSLNYPLSSPVSLASRTDQQMVRVHRGELASQFFHVATPLLSGWVFREAEVTNRSEIDFLAGPVTVYIENRFVGRAELPTVAQGETFVIGFGSDPQLRTRRELVNRKEAVQGGNRELQMTYRLSVDNYKDKPVRLRIMDRLPHTNRPGEIRIALTGDTPALSSDPAYQRRERPRNILRWDVEVPAEAQGEKSYSLEYSYTLDHDRNLALIDASGEQTVVEEFKELERMRLKK